MNNITYIKAPFGHVTVCITAQNLNITLFSENRPSENHAQANALIELISQKIIGYFQNAHCTININDLCPIETQHGSQFQKRVWQAIANIPAGQVRSYADIANELHSGPRAVANACGRNPLPILIPCHRVVGKNNLGGFMQGDPSGMDIKKWLLRHEGYACE